MSTSNEALVNEDDKDSGFLVERANLNYYLKNNLGVSSPNFREDIGKAGPQASPRA